MKLHASAAPVVLALSALAAASVTHAASLSTTASSAGSSASGSLSDSLQASSGSSTGKTALAEGDYRVAAVEPSDVRPQSVRVHLHRAHDDAAPRADEGLVLTLPAAVWGAQQLGVGATLRLQPRVYGVAFARTRDEAPFFLALDDVWRSRLDSHALPL